MPAPVFPSDFEKAIVQPEDDLCTGLKKVFLVLPPLIYKLLNWMFAPDGSLSGEYSAELCAKVYPPEETST